MLQRSVSNIFGATLAGFLVLATPLNFSVAYAHNDIDISNINGPTQQIVQKRLPHVKVELSKANAYDQIPAHRFPSDV